MKYYVLKNSSKANGLDMFPAGETIKYKLSSDSLSIPLNMENGSMVLGYQSAPKDKFNSVYKLINFSSNTLIFEKEFEVNGGVGISEVPTDVRKQAEQEISGIFEIKQSDFESICDSMFNITSSEFVGKPYDRNSERKSGQDADFSIMTPEQRKNMFEDYVDTLNTSITTQRRYKTSMSGIVMTAAVKKATGNKYENVYEINNIELLEQCRDNLKPIDGKRQDQGFPLASIGWYINMIDHIDKQSVNPKVLPSISWEQIIYFGAPGSGKSFEVKRIIENEKLKEYTIEDKKFHIARTTFHPDSDYSSFVGSYKPHVELVINTDGEEEQKITYKFVPQCFTDIYVRAWKDLAKPYYLIIEEINRGNCAQIFGDLFQLLDRNKETGFSDYEIVPNIDLKDYLVTELGESSPGIKNGMKLPPNLSIYATMNTSDQSLFPMDSAFKRRWSWKYVPIKYDEGLESSKFTVMIDGSPENWHDFLKMVNEKIKRVTASEDKQMGNFFIKDSVGEKEFCDKVMFYIWNEVGNENYKTAEAIFKVIGLKGKDEFSFNELYESDNKRTELLKGFFRYLKSESGFMNDQNADESVDNDEDSLDNLTETE